jgi:GH15 family glucan-1,4-alpha-glucosidase
LKRYHNQLSDDGLRGSEGAFLAYGFWLADNFALQNRLDDARAQFERVLRICIDICLLLEQYDPVLKRQLDSCPQAFSKLCLINTALNLNRATGPANQREKSAKFSQGRPEAGGVLPDGADDRARP